MPSRLPTLSDDFEQKLAKLDFLRNQTEYFISASRALLIRLSPKSPADMRDLVSRKIITEACHLTGAIGNKEYPEGDRDRMSAITLTRDGESFGAVIRCFTREFGALETEVVSLRAQLLAQLNNVGIDEITSCESIERLPDKRKNLVRVVENWDKAWEYIEKLLATGSLTDIDQTPYYDRTDATEIKLYIYEAQANGEIKKRLCFDVNLTSN